jgi:hypothetical protein
MPVAKPTSPFTKSLLISLLHRINLVRNIGEMNTHSNAYENKYKMGYPGSDIHRDDGIAKELRPAMGR